jgi:hypothetical protein
MNSGSLLRISVKRVLDKRIWKDQESTHVQYLVQLEHWPPAEFVWLDEEECHPKEVIREFEEALKRNSPSALKAQP